MTSLGETLRQERLKRNIALEEIESELKIPSRFLEAIEKEEFDRLPGGVFAKSFVRQYARILDLDDQELSDQIERLAAPEQKIPQAPVPAVAALHLPGVTAWEAHVVPRIARPAWVPAAAMLAVAMLVCSGVYAWWQRGGQTATAQASLAPVVDVAPAKTARETPKTPLPNGRGSVEPTAEKTVASAPETAPATASPATAANPPDAGNSNAGVRVGLTAEKPVWVSVSADGKDLFSGTLQANQTRMLEATDKLLLRVANAGAITVTLNGKPVGALGTGGQQRTVQFTSGGFQIVAAPKPSFSLLDTL